VGSILAEQPIPLASKRFLTELQPSLASVWDTNREPPIRDHFHYPKTISGPLPSFEDHLYYPERLRSVIDNSQVQTLERARLERNPTRTTSLIPGPSHNSALLNNSQAKPSTKSDLSESHRRRKRHDDDGKKACLPLTTGRSSGQQ